MKVYGGFVVRVTHILEFASLWLLGHGSSWDAVTNHLELGLQTYSSLA